MARSPKADRHELKNSVFISYRRDLSHMVARAVFQDLKSHGVDVFMDVEDIDGGNFDEIIADQIASRPYFVLILSPKALEQCTKPGDWLLREIECALVQKRVIVPVVTEAFDRAEISQHLGETTAEALARLNSVTLVHEYWQAAIEKLRTRFLKPTQLPTAAIAPEAQAAVRRKLEQAAAGPPVTNEQMQDQKSYEHWLSTATFDDLVEAFSKDPKGFTRYALGPKDAHDTARSASTEDETRDSRTTAENAIRNIR